MQSNELEDDMLKNTILAATAAAAALLSTGALAHDNPGRGWGRGHESHRYYAPQRIVVVPAPRAVYAPPPRVAYRRIAYPYYAAPVYRPVPVRPARVYSAPAFSIRFDFPL
jgi:hypothetical protein